jgi:hypothetical protein
MQTFYLLCAVVGGTVMICQFALTMIGIGSEGDVDLDHGADFDHGDGGHDHGHGHGGSWLFHVITFRTVVAAIAFFGTAGMASTSAGLSGPQSLLISLGAGGVAMIAVYWMVQSMHRFNYDGTMQLNQAIGKHGTVYVSIPGNHEGSGKVQVNIQDQTVELTAVTTASETLKAGLPVKVVSLISGRTVEVAPLSESAEVAEV